VASYPYVASAVNIGTARGPRRGIVWHHAEGGGTVGYLSRQNPNGVSVHFVVEYSGRVVRMLPLANAHTSLRTSAIRRTDDADGFYGRTAAKAVLGSWADTENSLGPNHATIGVEVEGFAKDGPNAKQAAAMAALYADMERTYPGIRSLGHRDFADYKACPGKKIPWERLGGHGTQQAAGDESVKAFKSVLTPAIGTIATGTWLYDDSDLTASSANVKVDPGRDFPYLGYLDNSRGETVRIVVNDNAVAMFTPAKNVTSIRAATAAPSQPQETPTTLAPGLYKVEGS
jgi:hypothetical protein